MMIHTRSLRSLSIQSARFLMVAAMLGAGRVIEWSLTDADAGYPVGLLSIGLGLGLVFVYKYGARCLAAIGLGPLLVGITLGGEWAVELCWALSLVFCSGMAAWGLRVLRFSMSMDSARDMFLLIGYGAAFWGLVDGALKSFSLLLVGTGLGWGDFEFLFLNAWLANVIGVIVTAPLVFSWNRGRREDHRNWRVLEVSVWLVTLIVFTLVTLRNWAPTDTLLYPIELGIFPLTMWAAIRFGLKGVSVSALILSTLGVWQSLLVLGPEHYRISQNLATLWLFIGIVSVTSYCLAAVMNEWRRREESTLDNERRLEAFIDAIPDVAFVFAGNGQVIKVYSSNPLNLAGHGFHSIEELEGKHIADVFPADRASRYLELIAEAIRENAVKTFEYRAGFQGQRLNWFEARLMRMTPASNLPDCVVWIAYNINARKGSEAALRRRDEMVSAVARSVNHLLATPIFEDAIDRALAEVGGAAMADRAYVFELHRSDPGDAWLASCRFEWCNEVSIPSIIRRLEFQAAEAERFFPGWRLALDENRVLQYDLDELPSDCAQRYRELETRSVIVYPIWVDRSLWGFVGIDACRRPKKWTTSEARMIQLAVAGVAGRIEIHARELELRRERDRADAASSAKGEFLAMMSHEIRTPMNAIIGYSDLLARTELDVSQQEQLNVIKRSGKGLLELINNILDYSKIESRSLELEEVDFDLEQVVCEALEYVLAKSKEKGLSLDYYIEPSIPDQYTGDPHRLAQVLLNLLNNAVKFTDSGGIEVRVARRADGGARFVDELLFSVRDTGIGIEDDKYERIFQPFRQVDSSTTRQYGGTGLGLVICKRLIERMGGSIWLESELGTGTTFFFTLNLSRPEKRRLTRNPFVSQYNPDALDVSFAREYPLRVLLVEDDPDNSDVTMELLRSLGYDPVAAADGLEAAHLIQQHEFDCVLLDIRMPLADGFAVVRDVREGRCGRARREQYIIATTAFAMNEDRERCLRAGMNDYLSKPLDISLLKDALMRCFSVVRGTPSA